LEPELTPEPPAALDLAVPPPSNAVLPAQPTPAEALQSTVVDAVADTLNKIDIRAHLEMLSRTEPRTFRQWVEMALPKAPGARGQQNATIVNVTNALPRSKLDELPPGFDIHR
jgi:hypothetical protein